MGTFDVLFTLADCGGDVCYTPHKTEREVTSTRNQFEPIQRRTQLSTPNPTLAFGSTDLQEDVLRGRRNEGRTRIERIDLGFALVATIVSVN